MTGEGHNVRVVSLPSTDIFDAQDEAYRESVLPAHVTARVAVEAGIADYWYKYVGLKGAIIGMTGYGESAPADKLFPYFGFTVENIVEKPAGAEHQRLRRALATQTLHSLQTCSVGCAKL